MTLGILCLDARKSRGVEKALKKYGKVFFAPDINEALFLIADNDFDYYFIDADAPQAFALLKHLQHDPQLATPMGVILLTENEEEDCEAWGVDTYINRSRINEDLPFVFSHILREVEPGEAKVFRIAPDIDAGEDRSRDSWSERASRFTLSSGSGKGRAPAGLDYVSKKEAAAEKGPGSVAGGSRRANNRVWRIALLVSLVAALGVWLFAWGPLGGKSAEKGKQQRTSAGKTGKAASNFSKKSDSSARGYADGPLPAELSVGREPGAPSEGGDVEDQAGPASSSGESTGTDSETGAPTFVPPAREEPDVNREPAVTVSGPTQVLVRQTATYTALASGSGITYSWGSSSKSFSWSAPGVFTVSVTVTDSQGRTASASISVRVI